jgi:hypothetical protein
VGSLAELSVQAAGLGDVHRILDASAGNGVSTQEHILALRQGIRRPLRPVDGRAAPVQDDRPELRQRKSLS